MRALLSLGLMSLVSFGRGGGLPPVPQGQNDCTATVTCQVTEVVSGSFTISGTADPGMCECDQHGVCVQVNCKVDKYVSYLLPAGASWRDHGVGSCNTTQEPPVHAAVENCGTSSAFTRVIYKNADCTGDETWLTFEVSCSLGLCGGRSCQ